MEVLRISTGQEVCAHLANEHSRFDAVLVDVMWNDESLEWTFDGLDAVDAIRTGGNHDPVLLALQGHGFERDFVEEAKSNELVRGVFWKAEPARALEAIAAANLGRRSWGDPRLKEWAIPAAAPAIGTFFSSSPKFAEMCFLIAMGVEVATWEHLGALVGYSRSSAEKVLGAFKKLLAARREIAYDYDALVTSGRLRGSRGRDLQVTQQTLHRWCGYHSHYIISWFRRRVPDRYRLNVETLERVGPPGRSPAHM